MSYFIYNGVSSDTLGIKIKSKNVYSSPKSDISLITIPGRNGDILSSNKRYPNVNLSYTCFLPAQSIDELAIKIRNVKKWLYEDSENYHILSDTFEPSFFRKAAFISKLDISDQANKIGIFTITFSCMPFRYLEAGQKSMTFKSDFFIHNPYPFTSKPYIKIYANGECRLTIKNDKETKVWDFKNVNEYVECDSELMNFFKDSTLKNSDVFGDGFPELIGGGTNFSLTNISKIEIIPRWMCL